MAAPPEEQGVPGPSQAPQSRAPVPGTGVSITSGNENQWGLHPRGTKGYRRLRHATHKGQHTNSLSLTSRPGVAARTLPGAYEEELNRLIRVKAEGTGVGTTIFKDRNVGGHHCSSVELPSNAAKQAQAGAKSVLSLMWLTLFILFW